MDDDFMPDEQAQDDFIPDSPEMQGKLEGHESFLQRAIKNSRIGPFGGTSITAILPTSGQEATDFAKVAGRQIPMTRGQDVNFATTGPSGIGLNMAGIEKSEPIIPEPETEYGKNLEASADIAPWAAMGLGGITAGAKGIHKFFSKGNLPEEIEATKGSIQDIIDSGPKKVKERVGSIFDEVQDEFGERMGSMPGGFDSQLTSDHFAEALIKTADELGGGNISGSRGNRLMMMAEQIKANPRSFYPKDIQAQSKSILDSFGSDTLSKAKFYKNFTEILSREVPELANIKSSYAPVYDIARQSKAINKGNLAKAATGKIGPEQLGEMTQAQQMLGDSPNIVEQADAAGRKLVQQKGDLAKILGRQRAAKNLGKIVGGAALGGGAWKAGSSIYDLFSPRE